MIQLLTTRSVSRIGQVKYLYSINLTIFRRQHQTKTNWDEHWCIKTCLKPYWIGILPNLFADGASVNTGGEQKNRTQIILSSHGELSNFRMRKCEVVATIALASSTFNKLLFVFYLFILPESSCHHFTVLRRILLTFVMVRWVTFFVAGFN